MNSLYASPVRVYLVLGLMAAIGVFSGLKLPISLFPLAHHPEISAGVSLGNLSAEEFLNTYGKDLENRLRTMEADGISVEKLRANYTDGDANYQITFHWGVKPTDALRETQNLITAFSARFPQEARDRTWVWMRNQNAGFLALSLYSEKRTPQELYELIEPVLGPRLSSVPDAQNPVIWNPASEEIRIELKPEALASLQLYPRAIQAAISSALSGRAGGEIALGNEQLSVELPRQVRTVAALGEITIATPTGKTVTLSDLARIDRGPKTNSRQSFRTGGVPSLILWSAPKPGGNVKRMSEDILTVVQDVLKSLPPDVKYRSLVDPSEFIRAAVRNVFTEVALAALLAVAVLFVFIGSPRNILTAAIEIPLSIVLAFILMRLFKMNLNLISLGGLALSAGMNVDASVVVLENIFRHFEHSPGPHDARARLRLVTAAVKEVRFPIIASTLVSLIVFLPLALTSGLSQGILGDLALAVVFSHGFSAIVALILVPTVRLQLMKNGGDKPTPSPFEGKIRKLETLYACALKAFLHRPRWQWAAYLGLPIVLVLLLVFVLPRLPRELVGTPDTDWLVLGLNTEGNTLLRQMEMQVENAEKEMLDTFGEYFNYAFSRTTGPNSGHIMGRLKKRSQMNEVWKAMEARFVPTPLMRYGVSPWNPSELPIPDPPHLLLKVRGGKPEQRRLVSKALSDLLRDKKIFPNVYSDPGPNLEHSVRLAPNPGQSDALRRIGSGFSSEDIADLTRVATTGRTAGYLPEENETTEILLYFTKDSVKSIEDIGAIPIGVDGKIVPLRALTEVRRVPSPPRTLREDARPLFRIEARQTRGQEASVATSVAAAKKAVGEWLAQNPKLAEGVTATFDDPAPELTEAIDQLGKAMLLSLGLIFITLVFQFGTIVESLLVMVALPLGYIGVLLALYVAGSTLSLNSVLGVILLNGIAVANSILLVDFTKRLAEKETDPADAAVRAASIRLRPILITSLTTILGMTPLALGLGEGGRILQPLGIAVAGGMWFSLALTLFIVPSLHTLYLKRRQTVPSRSWGSFLRGRGMRGATATSFLLGLSALGAEAPLSYTQAIENIVDRNTEVGAQSATVEATRGRTLSTRLALLPSISLQARQDYYRQFGIHASRLGAAANLDFNLFRFGSDWAGMSAARREIEAEEQQLAAVKIQTESAAVDALNQWLLSEQEKEIFERLVRLREGLLEIGRKRFERGQIPKQEVDKLSIDWENERAMMRDAETANVRAAARVDELLGHHSLQKKWPWKERLSAKMVWLDQAEPQFQNRPDWKAAQKRWDAAQDRASQSWGRILPSLDLNLSYGYYRAESGGATTQRPEWNGGLVLSVPLFDRLSAYGDYRARVEGAKVAELNLERVRRLARNEWEASKGALGLAVETALARDKTLGLSRGLFQDNQRRFERGLIEANDLNVDQQRLLQSEILTVRGWAAAHTTLARLCFARGLRVKECLEKRE